MDLCTWLPAPGSTSPGRPGLASKAGALSRVRKPTDWCFCSGKPQGYVCLLGGSHSLCCFKLELKGGTRNIAAIGQRARSRSRGRIGNLRGRSPRRRSARIACGLRGAGWGKAAKRFGCPWLSLASRLPSRFYRPASLDLYLTSCSAKLSET